MSLPAPYSLTQELRSFFFLTLVDPTVHLGNFLVERPDSSSLVPAPEVNPQASAPAAVNIGGKALFALGLLAIGVLVGAGAS